MITTNEQGLPEIPDAQSHLTDDILTAEQRRERYREKLKNHAQGKKLRLKQFLLKKRRYFRSLDLLPRRKRAEDIDLMCRYYNGDQYGAYDAQGLYQDQREEGDFAYAIAVLSGHVDQSFLQLLKVKPGYTVTADDKDNATYKLVAQLCEEVGVKELNRVMEPLVHSELYNLLLGGESYCFLGWAPNKVKPKTAKRPQYKSEKVALPARLECADCKETVPEGSKVCPACGSTNIEEIPGGSTMRAKLVGTTEVELGENVIHIPHMLVTQRDLSAVEPEDSTFLIEYSYIDKHVAEWELQSEIEPSREGLPVELLLRFDLERGSNQTDAVIGTSRLAPPGREGAFSTGANGTHSPNRKQPDEYHFWEPSEYGQFVCEVDEPLPNGDVIPAGTILGDYYPRGAFIRFVGDTVMELLPWHRLRKTTLVRYGRIAGTNAGAGLKKIMPLQDAENDNFNLNQTVKHTVGHPLTVIDGHYVKELPGAGNVLKVTKAGLTDVGAAVKQFPGQAVNNSDGAQEVIEGAMQFIAGTSTVGGSSVAGAQDMRAAGTATGIAAMQEQAAGRQSGPVDQRIMRDKELIIQLLENIQEYSTPEQKAEYAKRYGTDVARAFFECDLRHNFTVGIKPNSDMPRSMALTQANYLAFGQAVASILPVAQGNPWVMEFLSELASSMGFPFSIGQGRNDRREAEYRLNVLAEIEAELQKARPDLATNAIQFAATMHAELATRCAPLIATDESSLDPAAPEEMDMPRIFMQVHDSFKDVYKDALFGEKAKSWSDAYKLVVIQLWLDHFKADLSQQAAMAMMQASVDQSMNPQPAPDPNAVNPEEMAGADHQRQMEIAGADHDRQLQLKGAEYDANEQAKDADLERKLIEKSQDAENQQMLEVMRQQSQASEQRPTA